MAVMHFIIMDEIQKSEMRNYALSAGFFIVAAQALLMLILPYAHLGRDAAFSLMDSVLWGSAFILFLIGIILIVLKNRDLSAITFLMMGILYAFLAYSPVKGKANFMVGIFMLILAALILTSKDKKKYLLFIMPALVGLLHILVSWRILAGAPMVLSGVISVVTLYFAFACASERVVIPGGALLKADAVTDFKASGSVLGYLLFAMSASVWAAVYLFGVSMEAAAALDAVCSPMLIFVGVLLWAVGQMRFTPVMFILLGFIGCIGQFMTGPLFYIAGVMFIVIGLFAVLRTESRILPAIMLIIYGCVFFITAAVTGTTSLPVLAGVLNLIPALIAVYLAFAVFSQRKLPLF